MLHLLLLLLARIRKQEDEKLKPETVPVGTWYQVTLQERRKKNLSLLLFALSSLQGKLPLSLRACFPFEVCITWRVKEEEERKGGNLKAVSGSIVCFFLPPSSLWAERITCVSQQDYSCICNSGHCGEAKGSSGALIIGNLWRKEKNNNNSLMMMLQKLMSEDSQEGGGDCVSNAKRDRRVDDAARTDTG